MLRQQTLFGVVFSAVFQVMLAILISSLVDLLHVLTGLPTFPLPSGFHFKVCLNVSVARFAACGLSKTIPVLLSQ